MAGWKESVVDGLKSIVDLFRSASEAYEGANRFAKIRVWILGVLGLDLLLTLGVLIFVGGRAIDVEVWFEQGFPSNVLIVRNEGSDPLEDVTLVLDGRYSLRAKTIDPGLSAFEVNREFRDGSSETPDYSYRPQRLEIRADGDRMVVPLGEQKR